MEFQYETNPREIEQQSFRIIRQVTALDGLSPEAQQVTMRVVHSIGYPDVAERLRFSPEACRRGIKALAKGRPILCDSEMVRAGLTKRLLSSPPSCFLNNPEVSRIATDRGETRSMASVQLWLPLLHDSIVIIGNAPTALFRLLEQLQVTDARPALVIGMPVGFIGAAESKEVLWDLHSRLQFDCITLLGRQGGSAVAAAACNALLRCNAGEHY